MPMTSRRVAMAVSCETTYMSCTDRPSCDDGSSGVPPSSMSHDLPWIVVATVVTQYSGSHNIITDVWVHGDVTDAVS